MRLQTRFLFEQKIQRITQRKPYNRQGRSSAEGGFVELEGIPDMVLEIVSKSSVRKDTIELLQDYWEVGIREYWLIDARRERLRFDIFRYTSGGYTATRKQGGWVKSEVFGKSFRLTRQPGPAGFPDFSLDVR